MIYLFDRAKKLQKIIPRKHIINATQTKVRNGIYQLAVEVPIFYEDKKGTQYNYQKSVGKAEFAGHFDDKNRFQLYKIYSRNITANEQGEFLLFDGVHIFFDEAKAMGNIHDRRFRDSEAKAPADVAFNSIGWTVIDYDVTERHDINFYRASVTDAWNDLISTYGVEFDYELQFDGRKIISKNIIMKKQIGKWTGQRFAYGTNVLTLTQEQDESEVYTAAVGRGRGEESGDGFGPRLEFGDIEWSKDGITKPVGQNYIELPQATAEYGFIENGVVKPRFAPEVVFEDVEDKKLLADSTYYWLLENCVPKATWKTEVARIGKLELGDSVGVLYKKADIIKKARVQKIEYNLLDPALSKLTLGDYHHFENRQMKRINAQIKRLGRDTTDRITRIKNEWNSWIDNQFTAINNAYNQALIDAHAQIEADRVAMTELIEGQREEFTTNFENEREQTEREAQAMYDAISLEITTNVNTARTELSTEIDADIEAYNLIAQQEYATIRQQITNSVNTARNDLSAEIDADIIAYDLIAKQEYDALSESITVTIDTNREQMETSFNQSVESAKTYAEQQAIEKAAEVQSNLETATGTHQGMIESLQENVINIDDFLGNISDITLDERLNEINISFEERIRNINVNDRNMLRGTQFDEPEIITLYGGSELITRRNSIRIGQMGGNTTNTSSFQINESIRLEANTDYYFYIEYQSFSTDELDYMTVETEDGWIELHDVDTNREGIVGLINDGTWRRASMHIRPAQTIEGRLRFGSRWNRGTGGIWIEVRLPYLTNTSNREWLPHPRDKSQSVEEISRRITELEDGRSELITRTEYDFETEQINQTVRLIDETVEESRNMIVDIENYDVIKRGSDVMQTVDLVGSKVWLNDVAEIGANLIPQSANAWEDGGLYSSGNPDNVNTGNIRMVKSIPIIKGETYTLSDDSVYYSRLNNMRLHVYQDGESVLFRNPLRGSTITFIANGDELRISLHPPGLPDWTNINTSQMEDLENPIRIKLERGSKATPMLNAISRVEQMADRFAVDIIELDGTTVKQANFDVFAENIDLAVSEISDDYVKDSSVSVDSSGVHIGSVYLGGEDFASIISVSPNAIDMITEELNLTGNLNVKGQIESLAVSAVTGNFADIFASTADIGFINGGHIEAYSIGAYEINITSTLIKNLTAHFAYINHITAEVLDVIDVNAGTVRTSILTANSIKTNMLSADVVTAEKIKVDKLLVEKLVASSIYTDAIETISLDAVDANIGSLRTSMLTANSIKTGMLGADVVTAEKIKVDKLLVEKLVASSIYTDAIETLTLDAIDINAGNIMTALLNAKKITVDDITIDTGFVRELFASNARIDELIGKDYFIDNIKALTIEAVEADISWLRGELFQANIIEAEWLKGGTALIDRLFATTAMFEHMMAKSAFVTTLSTVSIDTDSLTIRRKDGGVVIDQGMQKFGAPIITKPFMTGDVYFENQNYITGSRGAETFEVAFAEHAGRWATFNFNISLRHNSKDASSLVGVVVRRGTSPSGVHIPHVYEEFMAYRDSGSRSYNVDVPMPMPTFGAVSWTLEFYVIGDSGNYARIRSGRCWVNS